MLPRQILNTHDIGIDFESHRLSWGPAEGMAIQAEVLTVQLTEGARLRP